MKNTNLFRPDHTNHKRNPANNFDLFRQSLNFDQQSTISTIMKRILPSTTSAARVKFGPDSLYNESWNEPLRKLARFGMTNQEMSDIIGISISTFEKYLRLYPEFKYALHQGRIEDSIRIVDSLHKQALGYMVEETSSSYRYKIDPETGIRKKILTNRSHTRKHIQPNVTAAIYLLKARHGEKWADIYKVESTHTSNVNVNMDFSSFTDEELKLLEKIGMKQQTAITARTFENANFN